MAVEVASRLRLSTTVGERQSGGMARLIYSALASIDGYVTDADGKFDWAEPSEDVHTLVNELQRPIGTMLLGRRMYDVLVSQSAGSGFEVPGGPRPKPEVGARGLHPFSA